jgi:tRNA nucleotidyltransferase (CCA-adding enzyme)
MLARLQDLDLLSAIHKDLKWDGWLHKQIASLRHVSPAPYWKLDESQSPAEKGAPIIQSLAYILWLVRLPLARAKSVAAGLRMPRSLAEEIYTARALWAELDMLKQLPPSRIALRLEGISALALYAVYLACDDEDLRSILVAYASRWRDISPATTGHTLRALGLAPGPAYREILSRLRAAWIDGEINNIEEERKLLERLVYEATQING